MLFLLTDCEIVTIIKEAKRNDDGTLRIRMPANRLQDNEQSAPLILEFDESAHTVSLGKRSVRLSRKQFHLLRYVYMHGKAGYEELQDCVWDGLVTDNTIRATLSIINSKLLDAGLRAELIAFRSKVSIERVA
jgi:DNA-binding response OmpR family regulator